MIINKYFSIEVNVGITILFNTTMNDTLTCINVPLHK